MQSGSENNYFWTCCAENEKSIQKKFWLLTFQKWYDSGSWNYLFLDSLRGKDQVCIEEKNIFPFIGTHHFFCFASSMPLVIISFKLCEYVGLMVRKLKLVHVRILLKDDLLLMHKGTRIKIKVTKYSGNFVKVSAQGKNLLEMIVRDLDVTHMSDWLTYGKNNTHSINFQQ